MTNVEKDFCRFMYGDLEGTFISAIYKSIMRANEEELKRLSTSFYKEIETYNRYCNEDGYWFKLKEEFEKDRTLNE